MSIRRERREQQRQQKKHQRKIDWVKVKQQAKPILWIYPFFILFVLAVNWFSAVEDNAKRRDVSADPFTITGVITQIAKGKRTCNCATYYFYVSGIPYYGHTLHIYDGILGDTVRITFNRLQPSRNLPTADMPEETFRSTVSKASTIIALLTLGCLVFFLLTILFHIITGNRKVLDKITSRSTK